MDAGTSSEPTLHQMQPAAARPPAPVHQIRAQGAVPRGPIPPGMARPGVPRPGMVRTGPQPLSHRPQPRPPGTSQRPESAIPPAMFRFQTVERSKIPGIPKAKSPVKYIPPPPLNRNLPPPQPVIPPRRHHSPAYVNKNHIRPSQPQNPQSHRTYNTNSGQPRPEHPNQNRAAAQRGRPSQMISSPSTSYSTPNFDQKPTFENIEKKFPVLECTTEVYVSAQTGQVQKHGFDADGNEIELPPNCKLFNYKCSVAGVERTLLIPMPLDATQEDVMKMLPESFVQFAQAIIENGEVSQPAAPLRIPDNAQYIGVNEQEVFPQQTSDEAPFLVNQKQFLRIQRRRVMRQRLEMQGRLPLQRQKYLHESRHLHAINRRRGQDGRFDQKLRETGNDDEGSGSVKTRQIAQPLSRPVTTYAEIRPNNSVNNSNMPPVYYGSSRPSFRILDTQPTSSPPANLTPVTFGGPSTSTASTSNYNNYHEESITSYQQYQEHVQYPEMYTPSEDHEEQSNGDGNGDHHQKFTSL